MAIKFLNLFLLIVLLYKSTNLLACPSDKSDFSEKPKTNIVLHDEIIIDRPITDIWPQLLEFVRWYFSGAEIEHIKGQPGQIGYTLQVNKLRHEIISIRPLKSIVWKSCLSASCEVDYVFSDFGLEVVDGKAKFSRNIYSQEGFWSAEAAAAFRKETSQGKVPDSVRQNSLAFKEYMEKDDGSKTSN